MDVDSNSNCPVDGNVVPSGQSCVIEESNDNYMCTSPGKCEKGSWDHISSCIIQEEHADDKVLVKFTSLATPGVAEPDTDVSAGTEETTESNSGADTAAYDPSTGCLVTAAKSNRLYYDADYADCRNVVSDQEFCAACTHEGQPCTGSLGRCGTCSDQSICTTETFMIQEEKICSHSNKDHEYCDGESVENLDLSSLRRDDESNKLLEGTVISFTAEVKDVTHHPFKFEYTQENGKRRNSTLEPAGGVDGGHELRRISGHRCVIRDE